MDQRTVIMIKVKHFMDRVERDDGTRVWVDVHLITARSVIDPVTKEKSLRDPEVEPRAWIARHCDRVAKELAATGLVTSVVVKRAEAAAAILDEAELLRADCMQRRGCARHTRSSRGRDRRSVRVVPTGRRTRASLNAAPGMSPGHLTSRPGWSWRFHPARGSRT